jgi:uncharacterized protein YjbJ (UPF0337 family)
LGIKPCPGTAARISSTSEDACQKKRYGETVGTAAPLLLLSLLLIPGESQLDWARRSRWLITPVGRQPMSSEAILRSQRNPRRLKMKDKMRGKAEEILGKVTDDKVLQVKGKGRQQLGGIKEAAKSVTYDRKRSSEKR